MKTCTKCLTAKDISFFSKRRASKDGLSPVCKSCASVSCAEWRERNKEDVLAKSAIWRSKNADYMKEYQSAYKQNNMHKYRASQAKYTASNQDKVKAAIKKWTTENSERVKARKREWSKENPEIIAAHNHNRRSRKIKAGGQHSAAEIREIFIAQRGMCANCHIRIDAHGKDKMHVDHIVPLSRGGLNNKYNLQCLCPQCNLKKHAKDPIDWANENGRLL